MKNSPNREQMLFLIAGGIIMVLILAVVVFNMIREPSRDATAQPETRPVVSGVIPPPGGGDAKTNEWVTTQRIAPAPVFANAPSDSPAKEAPPKEAPGKPAIEHESFNKNSLAKAEETAPRPVRPPVEAAPEKSAKKEPPREAPKAVKEPPAKEVAKKEPPKEVAKKEPPKETPKEAAKKEPPKETPKEAAKKEPPKEAAGKFALNLGSYADAARAETLLQKIKSTSVPVYVQKTNVGGKELTRVRAGPFPTRAAAEEASRQVQKLAGIAGTVIAHGQ
ncbi:MAG: SPOR domain-containing protein [Magnetococcales bacterium]|nr:SPOR domain-containing protein [Magnetococcales bacterium]